MATQELVGAGTLDESSTDVVAPSSPQAVALQSGGESFDIMVPASANVVAHRPETHAI
jgi:hypothetical protein